MMLGLRLDIHMKSMRLLAKSSFMKRSGNHASSDEYLVEYSQAKNGSLYCKLVRLGTHTVCHCRQTCTAPERMSLNPQLIKWT